MARNILTGIRPVVYSAVERCDPVSGNAWLGFIKWSGLSQLREVVSLDGILCPTLIEELTDEDWRHNIQQDSMTHLFHDLEYLLGRVSGADRASILALMQNPTDEDVQSFDDDRFDFRGFDLMDRQLGNSALLNCGGFPKAFSSADLSACGLLTDHAKALHAQRLLRQQYPDEFHADCDVWAIWRMKRSTETA